MIPIRCPICGNTVRVTRHMTGGGRIDCFACSRAWITFPTSGGVAIQKIRYAKRPNNGTERALHPAGKGKHPLNCGPGVRQVSNVEVSAWSCL